MKVYLAIKYHSDMRNRDAIEKLSSLLEQQGITIVCMARDFEQWGKKHYSASELMRLTFDEIDSSDIIVIEFSEKGVGLGIEAGYAFAKKKPIFVLIQENADLSKTLEGIATKVQRYETLEDLSLDSLSITR